jgi:hypothetical protein
VLAIGHFPERKKTRMSKVTLGACLVAIALPLSGCAAVDKTPPESLAEHQAGLNKIFAHKEYVRDTDTDICYTAAGDFGTNDFVLMALSSCKSVPDGFYTVGGPIIKAIEYVKNANICYAKIGDFYSRRFTMTAVPSCANMPANLKVVD